MGKATDLMSRRTFVALSGGVIGSMAAAGCAQKPAEQAASAPEPAKTAPVDPYAGFRMGMQTWCVREFKSTDDVIKSLHELGLKYVEIAPTIHLTDKRFDNRFRDCITLHVEY